jgi:hypothetical protein
MAPPRPAAGDRKTCTAAITFYIPSEAELARFPQQFLNILPLPHRQRRFAAGLPAARFVNAGLCWAEVSAGKESISATDRSSLLVPSYRTRDDAPF